MSVETRKVLELLVAGKINADQGERLLDKLASIKDEPASAGSGTTAEKANATLPSGAKRKFLRIVVTRDNGQNVNMRVPLNFLRSGAKLVGVLPANISEKLAEKGIDLDMLSRLDSGAVDGQLENLDMDIDTDGKHVRIFCE